MFKYFPHTDSDIEAMLKRIGLETLDDLFCQVDPSLKINRKYDIPNSHSELELKKAIKAIAGHNKPLLSFLGAGTYEPFQFSVSQAITSRQEFLTSYTPYQPEISQGTLQYIFEWQSMICELTGMDATNASMYDGATATAEAMFMAYGQNKRPKILISSALNPRVIEVVKTYAKYRGLTTELIATEDYQTSLADLKTKLNEEVSAVIVQQPNFYGIVEDYSQYKDLISANNSLFIMNVDPSTLPVLKTPREWGAGIACGDAQPLGIAPNWGGPYVGFLATTAKYLRRLPGRICGQTKDVDGKRGFVLTLQAREQHIRREKANSNICSNQSLMALQVVTYLSLLGKQGTKEVALRAYNNAHYLYDGLIRTGKFVPVTKAPFFKEFVLKYCGDAEKLQNFLLEKGILGGYRLTDREILFYASETRTKEELDLLVRLVGECDVR